MAPFEAFTGGGIKGENERARVEADKISGHHSADLYDQNEDAAGETTDLATGRPILNDLDSVQAVKDHLRAVEHGTQDALPDLEVEDDAAAKWLRENGG